MFIAVQHGVDQRGVSAGANGVEGIEKAVVVNVHIVDLLVSLELAGLVSDVAYVQGQRTGSVRAESTH